MCDHVTLQTPLNTGFLPVFGSIVRFVYAWRGDKADGKKLAVVSIQR